MGNERVTVKNLEIVGVDPVTQTLSIKGAVPGARGSLLIISSAKGTIDVDLPEVASEVVLQTASV